jgi:hypothetical protein
MAMPGRMLHCTPIPPEYAKVQVVKILKNHLNDELDIPTGEIQLLGDAVNQFILWHRRDIILTVAPQTHQSNSNHIQMKLRMTIGLIVS